MYNYLGEDNQGTETRGNFPDEASIGSEPFDIPFIATVEEDGPQARGTHPVLGIDQVTLLKRR